MENDILSEIPEDWETTILEEVVADQAGGDWGNESPDTNLVECLALRGTDFPKAEGKDLSSVPVRYVRPNSARTRKLFSGDLLIEMSGGSKDQQTGRALLATPALLAASDKPLLFSNFVKRLRFDTSWVDPEFAYRFWSFLYQMKRMFVYEKRTTGIRNFKLGDFLANERIALPPLPEQKAIAHVLRTVQQAKEATAKVIAAARQLKASLMRHLFTYGPVPFAEADQVELKETEIGRIPSSWQVAPLGEYLTETQYGLSKRGEEQGKYPILRMNNLAEGKLRLDDLQHVDLEDDEFSKFALRRGDLLFNRTNSFELVGKTSLYLERGPFVFASYLIRVAPDHARLHSGFLNYYMNLASTQARLKQLASRAVSQSNINATKLRGFLIQVAPLGDQEQIAALIDCLERKREAEEARALTLGALFISLLENLMTGRVRVSELEWEDKPKKGRKRSPLAEFFGKWPGDETDEQVRRALEEMD